MLKSGQTCRGDIEGGGVPNSVTPQQKFANTEIPCRSRLLKIASILRVYLSQACMHYVKDPSTFIADLLTFIAYSRSYCALFCIACIYEPGGCKWAVPHYHERPSFPEYRLPKGWKTAYRRPAQDTAIPHVKISINEIPHEKKFITVMQ